MSVLRLIQIVAAALVCLLLVGVTVGAASLHPLRITMENWFPYYQPVAPSVPPHRPIQWVNPTATAHTIRHDACTAGGPCAFDSGAVPPNAKFEIPGLPPGRYPYHCEIHPVMRGEVHVLDPARSSQTSPSTT